MTNAVWTWVGSEGYRATASELHYIRAAAKIMHPHDKKAWMSLAAQPESEIVKHLKKHCAEGTPVKKALDYWLEIMRRKVV